MVTAFVLAAGQTRGGPGLAENRLPAELLAEAEWIEESFEGAFDNLKHYDARELALRLSEAVKPSGEFTGDYEVVFCEVGLKEAGGGLKVVLRVRYLLLDGSHALERGLERVEVIGHG
jgi:hypothetical protein